MFKNDRDLYNARADRLRLSHDEYLSRDFSCFPHGVSSRKSVARLSSRTEKQSSSRRGRITSFSSHSRLRLRRALVESSLPRCLVVGGLTLTLPWRVPSGVPPCFFSRVMEDWRIVFHRFSVLFRRRFPCSCAIFRHELQRRKMPHCHMVCYFSKLDVDFPVASLEVILSSLWSRACSGFCYDFDLFAFSKHGCKFEVLDGSLSSLFRYLCDHASKKKQAQMGYRGKQWGYLNRRVIVASPSFKIDIIPDYKPLFVRCLEKLSRKRLKSSCVFGSRLSPRRFGRSVVYVEQHIVDSIVLAIHDGRICRLSDLPGVCYLS